MSRSVQTLAIAVTAVTLLSPLTTFGQSQTPIDLAAHPYEAALSLLKNEGVLQGYPDGLFRPDGVVNRAEFMKIVLLANHIEPSGQDCFPDVTKEWFAPWVCAAAKSGIVSGYPDGLFHAERTISFVEGAKMLAKASGFSEKEGTPWYKGYTDHLASLYAIPPSITGFDHLLTRGEAATMVWIARGDGPPQDKELSLQEQNWLVSIQLLEGDSLNFEKLATSSKALADHTLDFKSAEKKIVLSGTNVRTLCTPVFANSEASNAAWTSAYKNGTSDTATASFYKKYCPNATGSEPYGNPVFFPYFSDQKAFVQEDPGGSQEMSLMTEAEIQAYEKKLTRPVTSNAGVKTWSACNTDQRQLAQGVTARTLTCTEYHQEEGDKAGWLVPNTHCFIPVSKDLYFAYRIPGSAIDSGLDGCRQLRAWGIRSIRLK